ncbi:hypothetical protein HYX18_04630 [Candidatus Woesearchaeota archaeon]|nr:hypothetical protein [Candidatus Woesearchaeota archaeon]
MKLLKEKEFTLLNRKRYLIELPHENKPTPKNEEVKKEVASFLKIPEELIHIRHIYTNYGSSSSRVIVHSYKNKENLQEVEFKKKKPKKEKEKKTAAPPAK